MPGSNTVFALGTMNTARCFGVYYLFRAAGFGRPAGAGAVRLRRRRDELERLYAGRMNRRCCCRSPAWRCLAGIFLGHCCAGILRSRGALYWLFDGLMKESMLRDAPIDHRLVPAAAPIAC